MRYLNLKLSLMKFRRLLISKLINIYRLSKLHHWWHEDGYPCRFIPSCSEYAIRVITERGFIYGIFRTIWRLARCNSWNNEFYVDFPPIAYRNPSQFNEIIGFRLERCEQPAFWRMYIKRDLSKFIEFLKEDTIGAKKLSSDLIIVLVKSKAVLKKGHTYLD